MSLVLGISWISILHYFAKFIQVPFLKTSTWGQGWISNAEVVAVIQVRSDESIFCLVGNENDPQLIQLQYLQRKQLPGL